MKSSVNKSSGNQNTPHLNPFPVRRGEERSGDGDTSLNKSEVKSRNDSTRELLRRYLKKDKFPSSYLFTGNDAQRRRDVAGDFAKALNCESGNYFESCDCTSCKKVKEGNHPDVRWYGIDEDERSIKIEAIRDLQNWLSFKPYEGKVKVFILNEAGRLTGEAQNALLKSLEEPPPNSVLILLTQKKADLFDTVVSRLTEIKVTPYREEEITQGLSETGVSLEQARFLARLSFGNLEYAKSLAEPSRLKEKREIIKTLLADRINGFEKFTARPRKEAFEVLELLSAWLRDACVLKADDSFKFLVHEEYLDQLKSFAEPHSIERLFELFDTVQETKKAIEDNVNQKLAFSRLQVIWSNFLK